MTTVSAELFLSITRCDMYVITCYMDVMLYLLNQYGVVPQSNTHSSCSRNGFVQYLEHDQTLKDAMSIVKSFSLHNTHVHHTNFHMFFHFV